MVLKLLLLMALVGGVWWTWRNKAARSHPPRPRQEALAERMVSCAHCAVHLPESESMMGGGRSYCSEAHRTAGPASPLP